MKADIIVVSNISFCRICFHGMRNLQFMPTASVFPSVGARLYQYEHGRKIKTVLNIDMSHRMCRVPSSGFFIKPKLLIAVYNAEKEDEYRKIQEWIDLFVDYHRVKNRFVPVIIVPFILERCIVPAVDNEQLLEYAKEYNISIVRVTQNQIRQDLVYLWEFAMVVIEDNTPTFWSSVKKFFTDCKQN